LASSASGFASFILALNQLCQWELASYELSILARLGSGSACRSIWPGFVEWQMGTRTDGMDSHGILIDSSWEELGIGLFIVSEQEKKISSREAMQRTKESSCFYPHWPKKAVDDLITIKESIFSKEFETFGKTAESNALTMHAMMLSSSPPISYFEPETINAMQRIWEARQEGLSLYFTQDAGPNLKFLFLKKEEECIKSLFPKVHIIYPFNKLN
jgi:diphosphomevalonate decarboxylase